MRRPPDARLHARGGVAPAQEEGRPHALAGVSRQRRRDGAGHVPRHPTCCATAAPRPPSWPRRPSPTRSPILGFPPSHWKRLRTNNVQERANREIKRRPPASCRCSRRRSRWNAWSGPRCASRTILVGIALLRARQDAGALRRRARRVAVRPWRRGRAHGRGEKDDPREPRACGKGRGGVAYPARFQVKARAEALPVSNCRSLGPPSAAPRWNGLHQHPATLPHVQKG